MGPIDDVFTVREVAETLKVSQMTVYRLIEHRELRAMRVGRSWRIRESHMRDYLDRATAGQAGS